MFPAADSILAVVKNILGCGTLLIALTSVYLVTRVLLSAHSGYHIGQQIAAAIGLTTVMLGFIALGLSYTPWGINYWPLVIALAVVSVANLTIVGYLQRRQRENSKSPVAFKAWWQALSLKDSLSWLFLGFAVSLSIGLVPILVRNQQETFTEFFVDQSVFSRVPPWRATLAPGDKISIPLTVVSHETDGERFYLQVLVDDQQYPITDLGILMPGQDVTNVLSLSVDRDGLHEVELNLYKGEVSLPYRSLSIWLQVRSD